jgi:hypothetical protein
LFPHRKILELADNIPDDDSEAFSVNGEKLYETLERFSQFMQAVADKLVVITGKQSENVIRISGVASHAKVSDSCIALDVRTDFKCEWPLDVVLPYFAFLAKARLDLSVRFSDKSPYYLKCDVAMLILSRKAN